MQKQIEIKAKNKKQALEQALDKMRNDISEDLKKSDLEIKSEKKISGFLGLRNKGYVYQVGIKEFPKQKTVQKIDSMVEEVSVDGEFQVKVAEEGVMVKVIPPQGEGDQVHYQQIKKALEKKEIVEVDWQTVQEVVNEPQEEWVKVAPRKPELDRDAEIHVEVSDDKLKAYLDYIPALGGEKLTFKAFEEALGEAGVEYGIKEEKLRTLVQAREKAENVLIAEGQAPVAGNDAEIIYHFEQKEDSIGTERDDGSIDFYNLGLINNVQPGDVLVTIKEPEPGKPGLGVDGNEIPPQEPQDKSLPSGKNVEARDERTLVASIEGQVVKEKNKVNVLPVHEVNGNVDLNTGNINFVGNVLIKGDVLEGFEVHAGGNVEIRGNVNAAQIFSGGEVLIHKGFVGKNKGKIEAQGDVKIKFVENGNVRSASNIIVTDAVMHSTLIAGEKIDVSKSKGLLVGGKSRATSEIEANIIGSSFATETELETGVDPECKEKIQELNEKIEKNKKNILKTSKALKLLEKMKKKKGKLPPDKEKMYQQLKETKQRLEENNESTQKELEELECRVHRMGKGKIVINKKIFPGVKISIGKAQYNVHNPMNTTTFISENGEVKQSPHS
ncbi:MAG: DUF342 domain-containing protein [Halanaerobiaceae bacterium]